MEIISKINKVLNKPFVHEQTLKNNIITILLTGVFVFLFLIVLQPFDIQSIDVPNKVILIAGYGLVTSIAMAITEIIIPLIIPQKYIPENWTVKKHILHYLALIILIMFLNTIYSSFININTESKFSFFELFFFHSISTLIVGIFPLTATVLILQNKYTKENLKTANMLNAELRKIKKTSIENTEIVLNSYNNKKSITISVHKLLYINSEDNYVIIYHVVENQIKKEILRNTLKNIENQLSLNKDIIRCHKSYIVNLSKVENVSGNAQGYKLFIKDIENSIPVSRKLSKEIVQKLMSLNN